MKSIVSWSLEGSSTYRRVGLEGSLYTLFTATILLSGDFQRVVKGEVFMLGAWVFLFHNTCGVMRGLLVFLSLLYLALYIAMLLSSSLCVWKFC